MSQRVAEKLSLIIGQELVKHAGKGVSLGYQGMTNATEKLTGHIWTVWPNQALLPDLCSRLIVVEEELPPETEWEELFKGYVKALCDGFSKHSVRTVEPLYMGSKDQVLQ